jgi:L-ascorbate metabolism protein UlaG (beta-lactamase superfamily)
MRQQHVDPAEAVRAFEALGAKRMLAMHWGTFKLTDEPLDEPPVLLEAERARRGLAPERVRAIAIGETVELPPAAALR